MIDLVSGDRLVLIGDSITDCGRTRPVGEGLFGALGNGYVSVLDAIIAANDPARLVRVTNMGCSGNTSSDLVQRWDSDVVDLRPDVLTIMIGTNDVWRQFDSPGRLEHGVNPEAYRNNLVRLVERTQHSVRGLLLATPFFLESLREDRMRARMDEYGAIVKEVAALYQTDFLDTQALFEPYLAERHSSEIAWDRVHPTLTGHFILAQGFARSLGIPI
jgi:lysophospholipase L1-like esterase